MAGVIESSRLLVVEGNDDQLFLEALLADMGIADAFQIHNAGGKDKIAGALRALVLTPGFERVEALAILRDADSDWQAALRSCQSALRDAGLAQPQPSSSSPNDCIPRSSVFLFPGQHRCGALEDLLLETVADEPIISCVNAFEACLKERVGADSLPRSITKFRAKAYLSAMPENVPHIGLAAQKRYWNLRHPHLDELRRFLEAMR